MRVLRQAAIAAIPSLALISANANAAETCWYPYEAKAAQLRDFQTMMMVGTLQCRNIHQSAVDSYNDFIIKQRGLLNSNAYVLKAHFMRENGIKGGQEAYDNYGTALANRHASRMDDRTFCSTVDTFVRMAAAASPPDLWVLAQSMSDPPESGPCPPSNYVMADPATEEATPVPEQASLTVPASPALAAEPEVQEAAAAAQPEAQPAAVNQSASTSAALQAAVVALQSAAAALQAANASSAPADAPKDAADAADQPNVTEVVDAPVVPPEPVEE